MPACLNRLYDVVSAIGIVVDLRACCALQVLMRNKRDPEINSEANFALTWPAQASSARHPPSEIVYNFDATWPLQCNGALLHLADGVSD